MLTEPLTELFEKVTPPVLLAMVADPEMVLPLLAQAAPPMLTCPGSRNGRPPGELRTAQGDGVRPGGGDGAFDGGVCSATAPRQPGP